MFLTLSIIVTLLYVISLILGVSYWVVLSKIVGFVVGLAGKLVGKKERRFHRERKLGLLKKDSFKSKTYDFLNDLVIDLGLKIEGVSPYQFQFGLILMSIVGGGSFSIVLFGSLWTLPFTGVIFYVTSLGVLYTRASLAHDTRVDAILEAENIISTSIREGVLVAVKNNISSFPKVVRDEYIQFVDELEYQNVPMVSALMSLSDRLGSLSLEFIYKLIAFETNEQAGEADTFRLVIKQNGMKLKERFTRRAVLDEKQADFVVTTGIIGVFIAIIAGMFEDVRVILFKSFFGQLVFLVLISVVVSVFIYLATLRAKEVGGGL